MSRNNIVVNKLANGNSSITTTTTHNVVIIHANNVTKNDVLFTHAGDQSASVQVHEGNIRYLQLLYQYAEAYSKASTSNDEKDQIVNLIIINITSKNSNSIAGRFLCKVTTKDMNKLNIQPINIPYYTNSWILITDYIELKKIIKHGFNNLSIHLTMPSQEEESFNSNKLKSLSTHQDSLQKRLQPQPVTCQKRQRESSCRASERTAGFATKQNEKEDDNRKKSSRGTSNFPETTPDITSYVLNSSDITDNDVVFGPGLTGKYHQGNIQYRQLLSQYIDQYFKNNSNKEKAKITDYIIKTMKQRYAARFLLKVKTQGNNIIINDTIVSVDNTIWIVIQYDSDELKRRIRQSFQCLKQDNTGRKKKSKVNDEKVQQLLYELSTCTSKKRKNCSSDLEDPTATSLPAHDSMNYDTNRVSKTNNNSAKLKPVDKDEIVKKRPNDLVSQDLSRSTQMTLHPHGDANDADNKSKSEMDSNSVPVNLFVAVQNNEHDEVKKMSAIIASVQQKYDKVISKHLSRLNQTTTTSPPPPHGNKNIVDLTDETDNSAAMYNFIAAQNNPDDCNVTKKKSAVTSSSNPDYGTFESPERRYLEEIKQHNYEGLLFQHNYVTGLSMPETNNNASLFDDNLDNEQKEDNDNVMKKSALSFQQPKYDNFTSPRFEEKEQTQLCRADNIGGSLSDNAMLFDLNLDDNDAQEAEEENGKQTISALSSLRPEYDNYVSQPNIKPKQTTSVQDKNLFGIPKTDNDSFVDQDSSSTAATITPPQYVAKEDISDNDVLFGLCNAKHNEGNIRYRKLLSQHVEQYRKLDDKGDKNRMARHIIKTITEERNGHFLRKANDYDIEYLYIPANAWIPITDIKELQIKIRQGFRSFRDLECKKKRSKMQEDEVKGKPASLRTELNKIVETDLASGEESKQQSRQGSTDLGLPEATTKDNALVDLRRVATAIHQREQEIFVRAASNLLLRQQQERQTLQNLMQSSQQMTITRDTPDFNTERKVADISPHASCLLGINPDNSNKRSACELLTHKNDDEADNNNKNKLQKMFYDMATRSWY